MRGGLYRILLSGCRGSPGGLNGLPISAVGGVEALFAEDDPSAPALVEEIVFSEVFGQDFEVLESDPGPSGVRNRSDPRNSEPFRACHG